MTLLSRVSAFFAGALTLTVAGTALLTESTPASAAPPTSAQSWTRSPYGPNDEIGAANNLSPAKVLEATDLITAGKVYSLGVVTGPGTPAYGTRNYSVEAWEVDVGGPTKTTFHDDRIHTHLGIGTQLDGLGHLGVDHLYYNGISDADMIQNGAAVRLGVANVPPLVTRGVMLDMAEYFGVSMMSRGQGFGRAEIMAAAAQQGVTIGFGDIVIFHTGWLELSYHDESKAQFLDGEPGLTMSGAEYLAGLGVVAIGADTWGLEMLPGDPSYGIYEVHQTLLAKKGVYILESINTQPLVDDDVHEFMFVLGQPKLEGTVQTIVNPIAIR